MTYDIGSFVFDNWVIVREIGSGAYGKVYEIRRNDYGITAKSALKVIRIPPSQSDVRSAVSGGMDEEAVSACFEGSFRELIQEIQFMAELQSHPNIVSYQDYKVIDLKPEIGWDIQIRMELLESLTNYQIKNDRMSEQQIMKLGIDIASALELSEEKGIIHCDIKPDNIFIDPAGNFKLSDFGVAKAVDKTMGGHSKKGTEIYMAPEIYLGKPYGKTVDIYSLGLVLYQLANQNRLPFYPINSTIVSDSECEEALSRRMRGDAVPAPLNVSSYLTTIILKAIAYDPDRRWQSAGELRKTLERIQSLMVSSSEPIRFDNMKTPEEDEETTGFFEEYSQKEAEKEPVPQPPRETAPEKERPDQSIQTNQTSSKHTSTTILKEEVEEGYQSFAGNSASNSGHKPGYGIAIRFIDLNENENNKESEVIPRRKKQLLIGIVVLVALAAGIAAFFLLRDRFTSGPKETITADEGMTVKVLEQPDSYSKAGDVRIRIKTPETIQSVTVNGENVVIEQGRTVEFTYHANGGTLEIMAVCTDKVRNAKVILAYVDAQPPVVTIREKEGKIELSAEDTESGLAGIYIGTTNGISDIPAYHLYEAPLDKDPDKEISYYAADLAGNKTTPVVVALTPAESIEFEQESYSLFPGTPKRISLVTTPEHSFVNNLKLEAEDPKIVQIEGDMQIRGMAEGDTRITATADGVSDVTASVSVSAERKASEAEREVASQLAAISVGDYITFGSYEQDNDTADGNEPIEWLVLKREGEKILVISRYGLESKCYNEEYANITWENCTLRKWLNDTFYEEAFSETARQMIIKATAKVGDNEKCGSKYENDTEDNIFLLSISETEELFKDNNARICYPTEHVKAQGYYVDGEHDSCFWWLRSPGANWGRSAFIDLHGQLYETGAAVQSESGVVRPALWINLALVEEVMQWDARKTAG